MHMWINHLRKSSLSILAWRITSMMKTLTSVRILALKSVDMIPLAAAETRVEVENLLASLPMLYRNQVDTL
jgi:hypothetical protein